MAAGDTALWLHNKLGSTDDLWSGRSICSQLSREKLINIQDCFHGLQSHVKVKLLLSFLHISKRNVEQWQSDLEEIISLGINDPDPWVSTIGEVLREYPSSGALLLGEQDNVMDSSLAGCVEEMKVMAQGSSVIMMPLECQYLNKTSLAAVAGQIPEPSKHFTIKRRPKSAALRAEILQKSSETIQNKRNHAVSSVPIKSRSFAKKMDPMPLKATPTRSPFGSDFRSTSTPLQRLNSLPRTPITPKSLTPRSSGSKIKLLELDEMPVGAKEAKRRKKIADMEALEAQKKEKEAANAAAANATASTTVGATRANYTPDYAAGLIAPAAPKLPMTVLSVTSSALPQPSPAYLPTPARQTKADTSSTTIATGPSASVQPSTKPNLSEQLKQQLLQPQVGPSSATSVPVMAPILVSPTPSTTSTPLVTINAPTVSITPAPAHIPTQSVVLQPVLKPSQAPPPQLASQNIAPQPPQQTLPPQPQLIPLASQPSPQVHAQGVKKGLSLTKDQMIEAQEMFKASNKVSRPEKALILGFMAGSRDNPCPQQGHVLSIKLSEREELIQMSDGSVKKKIEDTYFQMNYATGEWKRFLKQREVAVS